MAKTTTTRVTSGRKPVSVRQAPRSLVSFEFPWSIRNLVMMGAGIAVIILGYILLASGKGESWNSSAVVTIAPIVLVVAYCVIIPFAIMQREKKADQTNPEQQS